MLDTVDVLSHFALGVLAERRAQAEQVAPCVPAITKHNPALALAGHFPHLPRPTDNWPAQGPTLIRKLGPNEGTKLGTGRRKDTAGAVLSFLRDNPGCAARDIDRAIGKAACNTLLSMFRAGIVRREGTSRRYVWFVTEAP